MMPYAGPGHRCSSQAAPTSGTPHARGISVSTLILGAIRGADEGQRRLDETGAKASRLMPPAQSVADAVVKAVRKDKAELVIQPVPGRLLRAILDYFPALGPALNHAADAEAALRKVIQHPDSRTGTAA